MTKAFFSSTHTCASNAGLTLVGLAITLVAVGLIIGGVLTAQDLIKASEINRSVSDIDKYNVVANAFRNRYGGLPGDLTTQRASMNGMSPRNGSAGHGDGNSLIEGCDWREAALGCETGLFWVDLKQAEFIAQDFTIGVGLMDGDTEAANITAVSALANFVPNIAVRESAFVHVIPDNDRNYFIIANFTTDASGDVQLSSPDKALSALEAFQLDTKIDDGNPLSGRVRAISNVSAIGAGTTQDTGSSIPAAGECVFTGSLDPSYNTTNADFLGQHNCNLRIRADF